MKIVERLYQKVTEKGNQKSEAGLLQTTTLGKREIVRQSYWQPKMTNEFIAKEELTLAMVLKALPVKRLMTRKLLNRLAFLVHFSSDTRILDVGAAQGEVVGILQELGFSCIGVEPSKKARDTAQELSAYLGVSIPMRDGTAESLPIAAETMDIVLASSVLEHVTDVEKAFKEAYRVLKPGGVFWFHTASSLCPVQDEIKYFPFFGWYPDSVKRRIMEWARIHRQDLIGFTSTPAIHWFTPKKARTLLYKHGFRWVYDRWDLLSHEKEKTPYGIFLRFVSSRKSLKYLADIVRTGCSYAAVK